LFFEVLFFSFLRSLLILVLGGLLTTIRVGCRRLLLYIQLIVVVLSQFVISVIRTLLSLFKLLFFNFIRSLLVLFLFDLRFVSLVDAVGDSLRRRRFGCSYRLYLRDNNNQLDFMRNIA